MSPVISYTRDPRFAELDAQIAADAQPKYRHTMTPAAIEARKRNGKKGIVGQFKRMSESQRQRHGKRAQRFRVYRVTCVCGECPKCRHRAAKRKCRRNAKIAQKQAVIQAATKVYALRSGGVQEWQENRESKRRRLDSRG